MMSMEPIMSDSKRFSIRFSEEQYEALLLKRLTYIKETGKVISINEFILMVLDNYE
jgi:hypothetical protein